MSLQVIISRILNMTTNKPDYLDKTLIRPSRIDYNINLEQAS
jgi:ATP-dependent 26S proteasome regulatory subunit